jgi:site-specific DNA-methyltransferase (adenine-specific)/site-specific DNA-methyltransferase (cytosine-N4-specific)
MELEHVPCLRLTHLTEAQKRAYVIADNQLALNSGWDAEILSNELSDLHADDFDLGLLGFDPDELTDLLDLDIGPAEPPEEIAPQTDRADELAEQWNTAAGQLWIVQGKQTHRLLCGDSRLTTDAAVLMGAERVNVAVTSPPYASQRAYDEASGFKPIPPDEYVDWFADVSARVADHLAADGSWFINIKEHCDDGQRSLYVKDLTLAHVRDWGWQFVDEFVWTHGGTPKAVQTRFKNGWEPIFQFSKSRCKFNPDSVMIESNSSELGFKQNGQVGKSGHPSDEKKQGHKFRPQSVMIESPNVPVGDGRNTADYQGQGGIFDSGATVAAGMAYPSNVLSCGKNREALGHSAAYPVSLPTFFIKAFSDESDNVYDPFLGSGTTMLAAEQLNRRCFGMELSPKYVAVILQRMQDAGCECTLQDD